jgi:Na+/proline symporter
VFQCKNKQVVYLKRFQCFVQGMWTIIGIICLVFLVMIKVIDGIQDTLENHDSVVEKSATKIDKITPSVIRISLKQRQNESFL